MFDYNIEVRVLPDKVRRGKRVKIEAIVTNANKKVAYCIGGIKGYNIQQKINETEQNVYSISLGVPFIAPKGVYVVEIYAVSEEGEKGPAAQAKAFII